MHLITLILCLGLVGLGSGCRTVVSQQAVNESSGFPYALPKTQLEVKVTRTQSGDLHNLAVTLAPKYVADGERTFVLKPAFAVLHEHKHVLEVEDGLLKSVDLADTGKGVEAIEKVAEIGINIAKITSGFSGEAESLDPAPTQEELNEIISSVPLGEYRYVIEFNGQSRKISLPGTRGLLHLTVSSDAAPSSQVDMSESRSSDFGGIFAKTVIGQIATASVAVSMQGVYDKRIRAIRAKLDDAASETETQLNLTIQKLQSMPHTDVEIYHREVVVASTNGAPTVALPLRRAVFGETKNVATLNRGVITKLENEEPSSVFALLGAIHTVSEKIVQLPGEIVQLKIGALNDQQSILTEQGELADKQV